MTHLFFVGKKIKQLCNVFHRSFALNTCSSDLNDITRIIEMTLNKLSYLIHVSSGRKRSRLSTASFTLLSVDFHNLLGKTPESFPIAFSAVLKSE